MPSSDSIIRRNHRVLISVTMTLLAVLVLAGCAHQPSVPSILGGHPGFFLGLFHGLVAPFAFVGSLFSDVSIYAWPNNGGWYNFGFLLGGSAWMGGAAAT